MSAHINSTVSTFFPPRAMEGRKKKCTKTTSINDYDELLSMGFIQKVVKFNYAEMQPKPSPLSLINLASNDIQIAHISTGEY